MGGGGGGATTIQENALPDYAQPYVLDFLDRSYQLYLWILRDFYTLPTYAAQDQNETDGIAALISRATAGHPINTDAQTLIRNTLDGLKFGTNPKLDNLFSARMGILLRDFTEVTLPSIHAEALALGRFGGGSHNALLSRAVEDFALELSGVAEEIYAGDHGFERERRTLTLAYDIPFGSEDIKDIEFLRQAGLYKREWLQGSYIDSFQKWKDLQAREVQYIEVLGNAIRALAGAQTVSTVPYFKPSPFAQIASVAVAGLGMYGSLYKESKQTTQSVLSSQSPVKPPSPTGTLSSGALDPNLQPHPNLQAISIPSGESPNGGSMSMPVGGMPALDMSDVSLMNMEP